MIEYFESITSPDICLELRTTCVSFLFKASQFADTLDLHDPPRFLMLEGEKFSLGAGKRTAEQHDNCFLSRRVQFPSFRSDLWYSH